MARSRFDGGRMVLARQKLVALSLLARLTVSFLVRLVKNLGTEARGSTVDSGKWPLGLGRLCEALGEMGVCMARSATGIHADLLQKNEYLRTVNEEIIELTRSLEQANTELEATRDYLDNLIQNSADMIVSTGRKRIITLFNRRAEEVLGYRSDEVIGRPVDILYEVGEAERVERHLKAQPDGRLMEYEINLRTRQGWTIPARLTASLLYDSSGRVTGSVGACTDLTHIKVLEKEIMKQQKLLAIAELGGAASHELNQPLTVALGRIQLILRREGRECPYRRDLTQAERELQRMASLVRRMGRIVRYKTKPYLGQSRIVDLEGSIAVAGEGIREPNQ